MAVKQELLALLEQHRDTSLSGEELARRLGVTRAAVWKAVKQLKEEGHAILSLHGQGYTLQKDSDVLSPEGIRSHLPAHLKGLPIQVFDCVESTNTLGKKLLAEGAPHGLLLAAEEQTAGRGRTGRSFYSPRGSGLYMSLLLRPELCLSDAPFLTIGAAVATARAIRDVTGQECQLKWVNDVYLEGLKICGILTEAQSDFESGRVEGVVIGVGINCSTRDFPPELREKAASLGRSGIRNALCAAVVGQLLALMENPKDPAILEEYRQRSLLTGRQVEFALNGRPLQGEVLGIGDRGELLVRTDEEDMALTSGEVSIGSKRF